MTAQTLPRLYVVTNRHQTCERPLRTVLAETLLAGTRFIQLREKDCDTRYLLTLANNTLRETRRHQALLLINDRADIVKSIGADGVHLRSDSLPIQDVREFLGSKALIGKSVHTLDELRAAESDGADFLVLGPIYDTPSKRSYGPPLGLTVLEQASQECSRPIFAIGGITPARTKEVRDAGAYGVAVMSAILESASIPSTTRHFLNALQSS